MPLYLTAWENCGNGGGDFCVNTASFLGDILICYLLGLIRERLWVQLFRASSIRTSDNNLFKRSDEVGEQVSIPCGQWNPVFLPHVIVPSAPSS